MKKLEFVVLMFAGVGMVVAGCWTIYPPAGLIVAGLYVLWCCWLTQDDILRDPGRKAKHAECNVFNGRILNQILARLTALELMAYDASRKRVPQAQQPKPPPLEPDMNRGVGG